MDKNFDKDKMAMFIKGVAMLVDELSDKAYEARLKDPNTYHYLAGKRDAFQIMLDTLCEKPIKSCYVTYDDGTSALMRDIFDDE